MYKLLIVDDEFDIRQGLSRVDWSSLNIELAGTCEHGLEALKFIEESSVDIVLTDIRMPIMDGLKLVERINQRYPEITTTILTGHDDFEYARKCMRHGVLDYLLKPFEVNELKDAFGRLVKSLDEKNNQKEKTEGIREKNRIISKVLRKNFLKELLNSPLSEEEIEENCVYSEMVLESESYTICILRLDGLQEKEIAYTERDWKLILFAVENIVAEYNEVNEFGYRWLNNVTGDIYILLAQDHIQENIEEIKVLLDEIRNEIYKIAGLIKTTISCSIGSREKGRKQIIASANNARIAFCCNKCEEAIITYDKSMGETSVEYKEREDELITNNITADSSKHIIDNAIKYIKENFTRPITLEEISEKVYVNPAYLSHLFKQATGINFINYTTNCRVEKAKELLRQPKYKIQEVSEAVGYENSRYFSQIFKKYTGKTPFEYRSSR